MNLMLPLLTQSKYLEGFFIVSSDSDTYCIALKLLGNLPHITHHSSLTSYISNFTSLLNLHKGKNSSSSVGFHSQ